MLTLMMKPLAPSSTIMHARKSLFFCDGDLWVKKSEAEFDVAMGLFDGAGMKAGRPISFTSPC